MILLLLLLALTSVLSVATVWFVRTDGYGSPPPPSRWPVDPRLPGRPYGL